MPSVALQQRCTPAALGSSCHRIPARPAAATNAGSSGRRTLQVHAFRGDSSKQGSSSSKAKATDKQRTLLAGRAPRNERENAESVVSFVAVAALFLTGVLFVFPALLGGSPATTKPLQQGVNKVLNIKEPGNTDGRSYAPGPGPAAAPGSPATKM